MSLMSAFFLWLCSCIFISLMYTIPQPKSMTFLFSNICDSLSSAPWYLEIIYFNHTLMHSVLSFFSHLVQIPLMLYKHIPSIFYLY